MSETETEMSAEVQEKLKNVLEGMKSILGQAKSDGSNLFTHLESLKKVRSEVEALQFDLENKSEENGDNELIEEDELKNLIGEAKTEGTFLNKSVSKLVESKPSIKEAYYAAQTAKELKEKADRVSDLNNIKQIISIVHEISVDTRDISRYSTLETTNSEVDNETNIAKCDKILSEILCVYEKVLEKFKTI